jgi:hypothetical protein
VVDQQAALPGEFQFMFQEMAILLRGIQGLANVNYSERPLANLGAGVEISWLISGIVAPTLLLLRFLFRAFSGIFPLSNSSFLKEWN